MAVNGIHIDASPEHVFDVLSDPYSYADWVVGTTEVVTADETWPAEGSRFTWRVGAPPLQTTGQTEVLEQDPPRRLVLRIGLPVGHVRIEIELHRETDGTQVTLNEYVSVPLARAMADPPLHMRNARAVSQLKALVEGRSTQATRIDAVPSLKSPPHWLALPEYSDLIDRVERCYVAVSTKKGPHVTPTAFTESSGRIWLFAERDSLKVRMLQRDPRVGILIRDGDRSAVMWGEAAILDPTKPWQLDHLAERAFALPAIAHYALANRTRLGGYLRGSLSAFFELDPASRVLVSVAPKRLVLVENEKLIDQRGPGFDELRPTSPLTDQGGEELDLDEIPDRISDIAAGERVRATLGWEGAYGPAALPAYWHDKPNLVSVPAILLDDVTEGGVALAMDGDDGSDLDDQKGLMIRGRGHVAGRRGGYAAVLLDHDRTTIWEGADSTTVDA